MDTVRIDIAYRPLRIAWAIHSSDWESFRQAVRYSHTLWGGRYNPIVLVDYPEEARQLVEVFRADIVWPFGELRDVTDFAATFPHLIEPLYGDLFLRHGSEPGKAHVLDIHNALVHWRNTPEWRTLDERGIRTFMWDDDDPLADVFLMRYGEYPKADEIGIDYLDILGKATLAVQERIDKAQPIPSAVIEHPSIAFLTWQGLERHYTVRSGWNHPGYFFGSTSRVEDLVAYWNRRAAGIDLMFFDPKHEARYATIRPIYDNQLRTDLSYRDEHERLVGVWARPEIIDEGVKFFGGQGLIACRVGDADWNGLNIRPPMMVLGEESSLGVIGRDGDKPKVSFSFNNKPFTDDAWFRQQHLVASVMMIGGLYGDDQHTFRLPYVPELNELFSRAIHFDYDKLRVEPERLGIIIGVTDHDTSLSAMQVGTLIEKIFDQAGLQSKLSGSGLIARQLISRMGGVGGGRVFKVPGVRRLLKTYGPSASFTKAAALGLIGGKDPENPDAHFSDHENLYIEPRPEGKLTPGLAFSYLVGKGLFRIGVDLICPTCRLTDWIALDALKQKVTCELCGTDYDATRQLVESVFRYRRTGVLGLEKNTQGAVPIALVLEQLTRNLWDARRDGCYALSHDLNPKAGVNLPSCEVDFVVILPRVYPKKAAIILGESKDRMAIDANDIDNLRRVADAVPKHRFDAFVALTKLAPFSDEEIALAKTLNGPFRRRVIMLTARELEPYHIYERTERDTGIKARSAGTPEDLADMTHRLYLAK